MARPRPFVDRLLDKFLVGDGCWEWQGTTGSSGYGQIKKDGRIVEAHREMFKLFIGDIPEGKELDHLCHKPEEGCPSGNSCKHRRCVRPSHLEAVPHRINTLRGDNFIAHYARRTHCKNGHDLRLQADRTRGCRSCMANRARLYLGKVHIDLGTYPTRTEAVAATLQAKRRLTTLARVMKLNVKILHDRPRRKSKTDEAAA